jgi:Tol biopolymer transport system component
MAFTPKLSTLLLRARLKAASVIASRPSRSQLRSALVLASAVPASLGLWYELNRNAESATLTAQKMASSPDASLVAAAAPRPITVTLTEGTNMAAAPSPDGRTLAMSIQSVLWTMPIGGGQATRISPPGMEITWPTWSPDGAKIAFQNFSADGFYHIWTINPDGSGARQVTSGAFDHREPAWSPDSRKLAFISDRGGVGPSSYDVWTLDVASGQYERRTNAAGNEVAPSWSPDGALIAYASTRFVYAVPATGSTPEANPTEVASIAQGNAGAPAWRPNVLVAPDGVRRGLVFQDAQRQLVSVTANGAREPGGASIGNQLTTGEDVFPFPARFLPDGKVVYTAEGHPKIRNPDGGSPVTINFTAALTLERPTLHNKDHHMTAAPRKVMGIFSPAMSPDGNRIAFVALNDVWVMTIGQKPERLTNDRYVQWVPSWSPDGGEIFFSSDQHGDGRPDMYAITLATKAVRRVSTTPNSRMVFPVLSPDGKSFAYIDGANQSLRVHDVATGQSRLLVNQAYASNVGKPAWSPDGRTIALTDIQRSNSRHREGRNLIRTVDVATGNAAFQEPAPSPDGLSERFEAGPAWSPDGQWMAFVMNGTVHVMPVSPTGVPTGPARMLGSAQGADMPTWAPDSRTILYMRNGLLSSIQRDGTGDRTIPVDLEYTPAIQQGVTIIHAGGLWDGVTPTLRTNVEIRLQGNRITAVNPIGPSSRAQAQASGARFIDATQLTVMPGMWDTHIHPRVQDHTSKWWNVQLAYGITSVLSNGASTYHSQMQKEALDAGNLLGPRLFTGAIFDGVRPYYAHHRAIKDAKVLAIELEKVRRVDFDFLKAYVRAPAASMEMISKLGTELGIPSGSHFLSPGIESGIGSTTHLTATERMGYSWGESPAGKSYQDVIALYTQGDFNLTSQHSQGNNVLGEDPGIVTDPRFTTLMPPDYQAAIRTQASTPPTEAQKASTRADVEVPARILKGGGVVSIGTDSPLDAPALGIHARLRAFGLGMTNHEALQTVTINAAKYSHADHELGTVEVGKVADLVMVRGNPLQDLRAAAAVEIVMKNGIAITVAEILRGYR